MRKLVAAAFLLAIICVVPLVSVAQSSNRDHLEVGVFADYVRLHHADDTNFWGLGGRVGVGVAPHVNLEGEMAYDLEKNITNVITSVGTTGITTTFVRTPLKLWHGTFGPKIWVGSKNLRVFAVLKGGFLNFSVSDGSPTQGFTNAVASFGGDTNGVFYPGGGVEFAAGPFGLRLDVGDLMYFDNGANHNWSVKIGPMIRF